MKNYEKLNNAVRHLWKFVTQDHEGLGADEQAMLKNQCRIINAVANEIEDDEFNKTTDKNVNQTIQEKIHTMMERSQNGKS